MSNGSKGLNNKAKVNKEEYKLSNDEEIVEE